MDISDSVLGLVSVALVGAIVGRGLTYLLNFVIADGLGPEAVGVFAFGMTVMNVGAIVSKAGIDGAVAKLIPIYENERSDTHIAGTILFAIAFSTIIGVVFAVGIVLASKLDIGLLSQSTSGLYVFAFSIPILAVLRVGTRASQGFKETKYAVYTRDLLRPTTAIVLATIGAYLLMDIKYVIFGYAFSLLVAVGGIILFLTYQGAFSGLSAPSVEATRAIGLALPMFMANLGRYFTFWTDVLMLGIFVQASELGKYQIAYQTTLVLTFILAATNSLFPSLVAGLYDDGQMERLQKVFTTTVKWIVYFTGFGYLFLVVYANNILTIFGPAFAEAAVPMIILATAQFIGACVGPAGFMLTMSEHERIELVNSLFTAALNAVLNLILIQQFGILGAAIATATAIAFLNILRLAEVNYLLGMFPYSRRLLPGVGLLTVTSFIMYSAQWLPLSGIRLLLVAGFGSAGVFLVGAWVFAIDESDDILIESLDI